MRSKWDWVRIPQVPKHLVASVGVSVFKRSLSSGELALRRDPLPHGLL